MIYERGTPINLVERFWTIDAITGIQTPADPTTVTFSVEAPDGTTINYTNLSANVTHPAVGVYVCALPAPLPAGIYRVRVEGAGAVVSASEGMFTIVESGVLDPTSPGVPLLGPCSSWISGADVQRCNPKLSSSTPSIYDDVAYEASMFLYEISGRQFAGSCTRKVRPVRQPCSFWNNYASGWWYWGSGWGGGGWGYGYGGGWGSGDGNAAQDGCQPISKVQLPGYPVTKIAQVLLDGIPILEFDGGGNRQWRLDGWSELVRMATPPTAPGIAASPNYWPSCQNLSLDDSQPGTFSITYHWGVEPPQLGRDAAAALAGQLWFACNGQDCALPTGATRVTREGIQIERGVLANWWDSKQAVGIVPIDMFLRAYWPLRKGRRPAVFSPDGHKYARKLGA